MKCCIICFDFHKSTIYRQPWRYVYELYKSLVRNGFDVKIVSDGKGELPEAGSGQNPSVTYVDRLFSPLGWSKGTLAELERENPDLIIVVLGLTNFLKPKFSGQLRKIHKPKIGILTSPVYEFGEIIDLGLCELVQHFRYLLIHLTGALMPSCLIRNAMSIFDRVIVASRASMERLRGHGIDLARVVVIPQGIDESDLEQGEETEISEFKKRNNPTGVPVVLYFGSPLTLRGTDALIKAFEMVHNHVPSRLIMLSRLEYRELLAEERALRRLVERKNMMDSVEVVSGVLEKKDLKMYLAIADVVCLPFKLVISDVPISILESMAIGRPTISTCIDGIPELLEGRGWLVKPNDSDQLARSILSILTDHSLAAKLAKNAREFMCNEYPRWSQIEESFVGQIREFIKRQD